MASVSSHFRAALDVAKKGTVCEDGEGREYLIIVLKYGKNKLLVYDKVAILIDDVRAVFFTRGDGQEEIMKVLWEREDLKPTLIAARL